MGVANFTPDPLHWQHQGRRGIIKPGDIITNRDRGWENHVLNKLGPRGLVKIEYNDDEEVLKKKAMDTYRDFWLHNIQRFNELNEQQKNEGRQYTPPTQELMDHADLFDVELVGPWKLKFGKEGDKAKGDGGSAAPKVKELEERVGSMESQLNDMYGMLKSLTQSQAQEADDKGSADSKGKGSGKKG